MVLAIVRVPLTLLWLTDIFLAVRGLDFAVGPSGQCDPLNVTWSGGRMPFQLFIIPPGGTIRNISIPASAFDSDSANGFYTVQHLDLPQGAQFMLSMSDTDGLFVGGTSGLMTVGASQTHQICNTTDPGTDFYFSLDSSLAQCSPYPFTQYGGAVLPITILVNIPQGQSFVVHPPPANSFTWIANLTAGTPVAFSVYDAKNRVGGTSSIRVVGLTNVTSCLTSVTSPAGLPNPSPTHGNSNTNTSKGLAIGISIGVLVLIGLATLIGFCCYRQNKLHKARLRPVSSFVDLTYDSNGGPLPLQTTMLRPDEHDGPRRLSMVPRTSILVDTISGRETTSSESHISSRDASIGHSSLYQPQPFLARLPQTTTSHPRNSKWSVQNRDDTQGTQMTPTNITYPSDIMMHTDISESLGSPIELPPQYSENRPPLPGFPRSLMNVNS